MADITEVGGIKRGKLLNKGRTKLVYDVPSHPGHLILLNTDHIEALNCEWTHVLEGKGQISNQINAKVFTLLNQAGVRTAFVKMVSENTFLARECDLLPMQWVTRRLATGLFLKWNPGVMEGYRFSPPKQEIFFADDTENESQLSDEQIVSRGFMLNGVLIGQDEVDIMRQTAILVFEILERAWATRNCALVDMKIEFGVDADGKLLVADVIDADSWHLWPSGDKRLMVDKQVYRNLASVTASDLDAVKRNFLWVSEQLDNILPTNDHLVVVLMGSPSDTAHCESIAKCCRELGLNVELRLTSAHKGIKTMLQIVKEYEGMLSNLVFITVADRSNGLEPVLSDNTTYPVINCPPVKADNVERDVWSSLNLQSGLGCGTALYLKAVALIAAQFLMASDFFIWSKLRVRQLNSLIYADKITHGVRKAE